MIQKHICITHHETETNLTFSYMIKQHRSRKDDKIGRENTGYLKNRTATEDTTSTPA
jgi:hypothetical protein